MTRKFQLWETSNLAHTAFFPLLSKYHAVIVPFNIQLRKVCAQEILAFSLLVIPHLDHPVEAEILHLPGSYWFSVKEPKIL